MNRAAAEGRDLSRRRFLQAAAAAGGALAIPSWLAEAAGAAGPLRADEGVLVVVFLQGGNDGLNMVAPVHDPAYRLARGGIALAVDKALPLRDGFALHPSMPKLKARWDGGHVAALRGVGDTARDLSHFTSTARVMAGDGSDGARGGWLGRYLDGFDGDPLQAVALGSSVPLAVLGQRRSATALPATPDSTLGLDHKDDWVRRAAQCLHGMAAFPSPLGPWADAVARLNRDTIALSSRVQPMYRKDEDGAGLPGRLRLAARLVNADIGLRVVHTSLGGFDHHAGQPWQQANLLGQLDDGIDALFTELSPAFAGRVTVLVQSEFGRRARANRSSGTDHGTSNTWLAVGDRVRGGLHGEPPAIDRLDRAGNLATPVDHRRVYATLLGTWLGADAGAVLGGRHDPLPFLDRPGPARPRPKPRPFDERRRRLGRP